MPVTRSNAASSPTAQPFDPPYPVPPIITPPSNHPHFQQLLANQQTADATMATAGSTNVDLHNVGHGPHAAPPLASPPSINYSTPAQRRRRSSISQNDLLAAMREQQQFFAEQQRQLLALLATRPSHPRAEPSHSKTPSLVSSRVKMANPQTFNGSIKDTDIFLGSLENIFISQADSFPDDEAKIRYSLTFLTDAAASWRQLLFRDVAEGNFHLDSWNTFEKRFRETFGNPHVVEEARRKLWTIRQGQRTSEDFFLEFEQIRIEANLCDNSVVMFLQNALRPSLLDEVMRQKPRPLIYVEWKAAILQADQDQRSSAATKSFLSTATFNSSRRLNPNYANLPYRPRMLNNPTITNPSLPQQEPKARASSSSSALPNTTTLPKPKTCWKCGKPNHIARDCPDNASSSNSKVRALFEEFDEIDLAFEIAHSGAEHIRRMLDSNEDGLEDADCREILERLVSEHPVFLAYDE